MKATEILEKILSNARRMDDEARDGEIRYSVSEKQYRWLESAYRFEDKDYSKYKNGALTVNGNRYRFAANANFRDYKAQQYRFVISQIII